MTSPNDETDPLSRPLPSVDMPLLREERRASQTKKAATTGITLLLLGGGIGLAIALKQPEPDQDALATPPTASRAPSAPEANDSPDDKDEDSDDQLARSPYLVSDEPALPSEAAPKAAPSGIGEPTRVSVKFGKARGFRQALTAAGASSKECGEVEQALRDVMDFRRCRPEDRMIFERDETGKLVRFEYHPSPTEYFEASRKADDAMAGRKVIVPVDSVRLARGGAVKNSLGDALAEQGLGRALVGTFVEVFDNRINYSTQTREGDTFKIIVDEERIEGQFLRYGTAHALEYNGGHSGLLRAFWFEPRKGEGDYFDESGRSIAGGWLRNPCRFDRISSRFNPRRMHPILKRVVPHNGVDYAAGSGTPVWAAAAGVVTFAGAKGANGNLISIRHADGYETAYAHLLRFEKGIKSGVEVRQRQVIGYVGSTGRSTGPHLHFGLRRGGRWVDPLEAINGPGRMMPSSALPRYRRHVRQMTAQLSRIALPTTTLVAPRLAGTASPSGDHDSPMD